MAIVGGAVIPPAYGFLTDTIGFKNCATTSYCLLWLYTIIWNIEREKNTAKFVNFGFC